MIYTQYCKNCHNVLTVDEMKQHLIDFLGTCEDCRRHAKEFPKRFKELGKEKEKK